MDDEFHAKKPAQRDERITAKNPTASADHEKNAFKLSDHGNLDKPRFPAALVSFAIALLATPFALLIAVVSGGAGHGDEFWAKLLFPYTAVLRGHGKLTLTQILVAVVELPLYGLIVGVVAERFQPGEVWPVCIAIFIILAVHGTAIWMAF
jgi:hypothetical protein